MVRIYIPLIELLHLQSSSPPFICKLSNKLFIIPILALFSLLGFTWDLVVFEIGIPLFSTSLSPSPPPQSQNASPSP
jgi:hypothetical protein